MQHTTNAVHRHADAGARGEAARPPGDEGRPLRPLGDLFVAYVEPVPQGDWHIYLVNNTDVAFARVEVRSGEWFSSDDAFFEGNVITRPTEPLPARSARWLYMGEPWELDFTQWWHFDVYAPETDVPVAVWFWMGGDSMMVWRLPLRALPVLEVEGRRIELGRGRGP